MWTLNKSSNEDNGCNLSNVSVWIGASYIFSLYSWIWIESMDLFMTYGVWLFFTECRFWFTCEMKRAIKIELLDILKKKCTCNFVPHCLSAIRIKFAVCLLVTKCFFFCTDRFKFQFDSPAITQTHFSVVIRFSFD